MAELVPKHSAPNQVKKELQERKRTILYLIEGYLNNVGLCFAAEQVKKEAQLDGQYQICDNIDLDIILQEYHSYYFMKFQQTAKIIKKSHNENVSPLKKQPLKKSSTTKLKQPETVKGNESETLRFDFEIYSPSKGEKTRPPMKLCDFENYSQDWREMAELILKDSVPNNLGCDFANCIGLEHPAELLKEATIYPVQYRDIFEGGALWSGVLLFGPPGTGKTLLARALACETPGRFINVASSTFISKWRGDSEKMVRVLFDIAKFYAPCTVFIDELDAITCTGHDSNHEASKRFKSELLTQMDGILKLDQQVFVLATTNSPWKLDSALLRRFEKRILVPLPNFQAKVELFKHYTKIKNVEKLGGLVEKCGNFSGSDIENVCKEARMIVIREAIKKGLNSKRALSISDLAHALEKIKPCVDESVVQKYNKWNEKYGCV